MKSKYVIFLPVCVLGSCSIHPQVYDTTFVTTYEVVDRIRCETIAAIRSTAIDYLNSKDIDDENRAIWKRYSSDKNALDDITPSTFTGSVEKTLSYFWMTGVAFNFTLDMTETNNLDTDTNFLSPLKRYGWNLGVKAGLDRQRQNVRTFTITHNFEELLKSPPAMCASSLVRSNYIYPITGKIGIEDMVHTFVYLTLLQHLGGKADKPDGPPTLVDALSFTTTINGSVSPKVTFAPIGNAFQIADTGLGATLARTDIHKVVIGLAIDVKADKQTQAVRDRYNQTSNAVRTVTQQLISAAPKTNSEAAAANAVNQFIEQRIFSPTINVNQ